MFLVILLRGVGATLIEIAPAVANVQDSLMSADDGDDSEYDDDDVAGAACGLRAAGDGKFDIGLVFRMMDRDKDGVVSIRDWGVATGSGPGLGARMTGKQVRQRVPVL